MSNENLQHLEQSQVDQYLQADPSNTQALILSAYLEEKRKWQERFNSTKADKSLYIKKITNLQIKISTIETTTLAHAEKELKVENNLWSKLCKFLKIKTKAQKNLDIVLKMINTMQSELEQTEIKFKKLREEHFKVYSNPPKTEQYELAMIGNSLFKPR